MKELVVLRIGLTSYDIVNVGTLVEVSWETVIVLPLTVHNGALSNPLYPDAQLIEPGIVISRGTTIWITQFESTALFVVIAKL